MKWNKIKLFRRRKTTLFVREISNVFGLWDDNEVFLLILRIFYHENEERDLLLIYFKVIEIFKFLLFFKPQLQFFLNKLHFWANYKFFKQLFNKKTFNLFTKSKTFYFFLYYKTLRKFLKIFVFLKFFVFLKKFCF